jgi:hypothetical protein
VSENVNVGEVLLVRAAYDAVVAEQLRAGSRIAELFPLSEETRARWEQQEREEMLRRDNLMRDHLTVPGTTSVCRCGFVGYSTPGYLLHVYEVIVADHQRQTGCDW